MKTKDILTQIVTIPRAIKKNEFTPLQCGVCTVLLAAMIFFGLLLFNPSILKS